MVTVTSKAAKNGVGFVNNIAYNAVVNTPLGKHIAKDFYNMTTEEPPTNEAVADFNPSNWAISESEYINETTGMKSTSKWVGAYLGA